MTGRELYRTLGTAGSATLVKDINPGPNDSDPEELYAVGSTIYFAATDGANGSELWKSDGTAAGTVMVKNIHSTGSSYPIASAHIGTTLYRIGD